MTSKKTAAIDGGAILDRLHAALTRYVILPSAEAVDAVALWIAATHAQAAWAHAPRLVIRAPEKRCGKSRLLDVVEGTCHLPLITVNASPAAVYRAIGSDTPPTLLVDEADTIFGAATAAANEDLRGLLNAGHQRNRPALRYDANTQRVEKIPTFAMAALAGIGAMPDTIEDRAVVVRMRRRAPGESVAPYRHRRDRPALAALAADLTDWLTANLPDLERAEPAMPLEDRAADTWEPLIAVADLAAGDWPARARAAALILTTDRDIAAVASDRIRLLNDCRAAFGDDDALPTAVLLDRLKADPESPWTDHGSSNLTPLKLGTLLREYDIRSANIRFGPPIGQVKGYSRADFTDAWTRYCPPTDTTTPTPPSQPSQPSHSSSAPGRNLGWDGPARPTQDSVPALTSPGTAGTDGTDTPRLRVIEGGR
ncbi:DUF3631 domain-containing protein [Catellatospora chokoriensis]|uniref:DUF3631 domain-containing protein n=1 Tax=Catellatospora chokoriensis TaxID=310353 RepID=A0A8J3NSU9_9ACTN|nr:DUF3631 domain-containing protein [Catellatospora chokoriensis]GIF91375.1 hypothetical protein Cch02nite_48190 [Catellatospora chokoriensis]